AAARGRDDLVAGQRLRGAARLAVGAVGRRLVARAELLEGAGLRPLLTAPALADPELASRHRTPGWEWCLGIIEGGDVVPRPVRRRRAPGAAGGARGGAKPRTRRRP